MKRSFFEEKIMSYDTGENYFLIYVKNVHSRLLRLHHTRGSMVLMYLTVNFEEYVGSGLYLNTKHLH